GVGRRPRGASRTGVVPSRLLAVSAAGGADSMAGGCDTAPGAAVPARDRSLQLPGADPLEPLLPGQADPGGDGAAQRTDTLADLPPEGLVRLVRHQPPSARCGHSSLGWAWRNIWVSWSTTNSSNEIPSGGLVAASSLAWSIASRIISSDSASRSVWRMYGTWLCSANRMSPGSGSDPGVSSGCRMVPPRPGMNALGSAIRRCSRLRPGSPRIRPIASEIRLAHRPALALSTNCPSAGLRGVFLV